MNADTGPAAIGPDTYVAWRETSLGAITETLEPPVMLDLMGELRGVRVLDVGCGDGLLACIAAARGALATGVHANPADADGRALSGRRRRRQGFLRPGTC